MNSLQAELVKYGSVAVAFSGGIDSMVLLAEAAALPGLQVRALLAVGPTFPLSEQEEARRFCRQRGIPLQEIAFNPLGMPEFSANGRRRCYYCKSAMFRALLQAASATGAVLADGTNRDDDSDYRPGRQALKELGILSPLYASGWGKKEIRQRAGELGLPAEKPSMACLVSRVAYGLPLAEDVLQRIDSAETAVRRLGFRQVRVRIRGRNCYTVEADAGLQEAQAELQNSLEQIVRSNFPAVREVQICSYRRGGGNS